MQSYSLAKQELNPYNLNIVLFDIEATNLNADFGYILCFSWKKLGDKAAKTISITDYPRFAKDPTNDKDLVADILAIMREADAWVGWYSVRFDAPYINTRAILHGFPPLPPTPHIDGWWIARNHLKLHSNRLASVSSFLGLESKTALDGPIWTRAAAGHKPSIEYVKKHCAQDVEVLEQAYVLLRPFFKTHPNVAAMAEATDSLVCPMCGHKKLQKRGKHVTRTGARQRYQCTACGGWSSGRRQLFAVA